MILAYPQAPRSITVLMTWCCLNHQSKRWLWCPKWYWCFELLTNCQSPYLQLLTMYFHVTLQKEESIASTCLETWFLRSRQSTHTDTLVSSLHPSSISSSFFFFVFFTLTSSKWGEFITMVFTQNNSILHWAVYYSTFHNFISLSVLPLTHWWRCLRHHFKIV